jgi:malate/lactate dehydrogenase
METIVITPQSENEFTFLIDLFKKLRVKAETITERKRAKTALSMKQAAALMRDDYLSDKNLTAFSKLEQVKAGVQKVIGS